MLQKTVKFYFGSHAKFAIIGGGTAGVSTAAHLRKASGVLDSDIRVFEPSKQHFYQPAWSMVSGNIYDVEKTGKLTKEMFNSNIPISELAVTKVDPKKNTIYTQDGDSYTYDYLIVATGLQLDFGAIKGATEALEDPNCPVGSAYTKDYAKKMQRVVKEFQQGQFIFHEAPMPIKCPGAPQKVCFLVEHDLRKTGKRQNTTITYHMAKGVVFGVPKYAAVLSEQHKQKHINLNIGSKVLEVNKDSRTIVYQNVATGIKSQQRFDALHLVPHQKAPQFIKESGLGDESGFVSVNQNTLQHTVYPNVWALGDSSSCPTSKTAAAIFSQTPILVHNLMRIVNKTGGEEKKYDGYTSCPLLIGDEKVVLAEFKYGAEVDETFPVDQGTPRGFFYRLKRDIFPFAYWTFVPKGQWYGRRCIFPNLPFYSLFSSKNN